MKISLVRHQEVGIFGSGSVAEFAENRGKLWGRRVPLNIWARSSADVKPSSLAALFAGGALIRSEVAVRCRLRGNYSTSAGKIAHDLQTCTQAI